MKLNSDLYTWYSGGLTGPTQVLAASDSGYCYVQTNVGSCQSKLDSIWVSVDKNCTVFDQSITFSVPNVFTPNEDGNNDFFKIIDQEGISELECIVLNRWGNLVYESDDPNFKWDGTDRKGNELMDGTYFYNIKAKSMSGEEVKKSGFVHLFNN